MNFINPTIIAGFYNQVEHSRILQAVEFAVHQFLHHTTCTFEFDFADTYQQKGTRSSNFSRTLETKANSTVQSNSYLRSFSTC